LIVRDDETIKYQFKMILFPPKSRYFKSNIPDIIFKIECFRQKNNSPKIDTLLFHRPLDYCIAVMLNCFNEQYSNTTIQQ
jgi:hypothetical protein